MDDGKGWVSHIGTQFWVVWSCIFGGGFKAAAEEDRKFCAGFIENDDIAIGAYDTERASLFLEELRLRNLFVAFFGGFRFVFRSFKEYHVIFFKSLRNADIFVRLSLIGGFC